MSKLMLNVAKNVKKTSQNLRKRIKKLKQSREMSNKFKQLEKYQENVEKISTIIK